MGACCALESAPKQAAKSSTSRPTTPKSARKKGEAPQAGSDATLHDAAWEGNVDLVRRLLLRDSPDLPDEEGSTPLHLAADEGYMEVVKCLLEEGKATCMDAADGAGNTPCCWLRRKGEQTSWSIS